MGDGAISQIDVSYHDLSGAGPSDRVAVGDRAPALFEFDPTRHTLAWFAPESPDTGRATEGFADVVRTVVVADTAVWRRYGLPDGGLALIRPDGYLAYLDAQRDPALLRAQLNRTFVAR